MELRNSGHSGIIILAALLSVTLRSICVVADNAAEESAQFSQFTFPRQQNGAQQSRRQLSAREQAQIFTDIQEHHAPPEPRYTRFLNSSENDAPEQNPFIPQEKLFVEGQSPNFEIQGGQQNLFSQQQPQQPVNQFQTPQNSFSVLSQIPPNTQYLRFYPEKQKTQAPPVPPTEFLQSQFSQGVSQNQNPPVQFQHQENSDTLLQNSPSVVPSVSPFNPQYSSGTFLQQQSQQPLNNIQQQSAVPAISPVLPTQPVFTQQNFAPIPREQSAQVSSFQQSGTLGQGQPAFSTVSPELVTNIQVQKGVSNTQFTIQRSISDPAELQKIQELEEKRQQEQREFLLKQQQELQRLLQEQREREEKRLKEQQRMLSKILYTPDSINVAQVREMSSTTPKPIPVTASTASFVPDQSSSKRRPYQPQTSGASNQADLKPLKPRSREDTVGPTIAPEEQILLQNERQKLFYQLKEAQQQRQKQKLQQQQQQQQSEKQETATLREQATQAVLSKLEQRRQQEKLQQQKQVQDQLNRQFQQQLVQRQDLLRQLRVAVSNAEPPEGNSAPVSLNTSSQLSPIILGNGQKLQLDQLLRQINPSGNSKNGSPNIKIVELPSSTTTPRPPQVLLEELTKGVLPPGADFEIIRHKQDGGLEEVGKQNLPVSQKKVTFVFLEEQPDGSFKVRGVKGNADGQPGESAAPVDVDSIIKKLQDGDIKLPTRESSNSVTPSSTLPPFYQSQSTQITKQTASPSSSLVAAATPSPNIIRNSVTNEPKLTFSQQKQSVNDKTHGHMEIVPSLSLSTSSPATPEFQQVLEQQEDPNHSNSPYSVEVQGPPVAQTQHVPNFPQNHLVQPSVPSPRPSSVPTDTVVQYQQQEQQLQQHKQQYQQVFQQQEPQLQQHRQQHQQVFQQQEPQLQQHRQQHQQIYQQQEPQSQHSEPQQPQQSYKPQQHHEQDSRQQQPSKPPNKIIKLSVPFFPTNPSFAAEAPTPGIVYTSSTQRPRAPISTEEQTLQHNSDPNKVYRQNVESPSVKTPTRVVAPPQQLQPLDDDLPEQHSEQDVSEPASLSSVLKREGLFAMARFLRQADLDSILNETGPYTVFAPTDKAFRALLVQLGGPEKAEEKFKENPRLLSGLLLHHVIPGAFELSSLQDEMTGVSLAGTQLRVNTYTTQDLEWNELQVVTINGARVSREKHDIQIPQGIAHAVDRVMFPLPVGNIVQTLRSDRDRRYSKFLRAMHTAGLTESLAGPRMYTVFAPVDRAFSVVDPDDLEELLTDRELARALVLRHVIPGTLYSAGMRFFQLRDSLEKGSAITLQKTNGHVRANKAHVINHNIPATNGVIHAIDKLL